jgi:hypothetical protein
MKRTLAVMLLAVILTLGVTDVASAYACYTYCYPVGNSYSCYTYCY